MPRITTSVIGMAGGAAAVAGVGKQYRFTFGGTWAAGETFTVNLTESLTALVRLLGAGTVSGEQPTFAFTFNSKVYVLAGSNLFFCEIDDPTLWNDPQGLGNGFIEMANNFGTPEDLVALAPYQGKLAVISRRLVQIWGVDPDPANYLKGQTLPNIGTFAPLSVAAVGDMDVYLLADCGVRSVRVRDASNNALVSDIGSPVDELITSVLVTLTDAEKAAACSVVEPSSNRYWLYLPGHNGATGDIYVFSSFPSSGVAAWSKYAPGYEEKTTIAPNDIVYPDAGDLVSGPLTFAVTAGALYHWTGSDHEQRLVNGTQTITINSTAVPFIAQGSTVQAYGNDAGLGYTGLLQRVAQTGFIPEKFCVYNGRVYARSGDDVFLYGGSANQSYDSCLPQWDTPFLNAKTPATRKSYTGLDAACEGLWRVYLGAVPSDADDVKLIYDGEDSTFERGKSLAGKQGTHFKLRGIEIGSDYARFSSAILHFIGGDEK